jgi:hypothetical protein
VNSVLHIGGLDDVSEIIAACDHKGVIDDQHNVIRITRQRYKSSGRGRASLDPRYRNEHSGARQRRRASGGATIHHRAGTTGTGAGTGSARLRAGAAAASR